MNRKDIAYTAKVSAAVWMIRKARKIASLLHDRMPEEQQAIEEEIVAIGRKMYDEAWQLEAYIAAVRELVPDIDEPKIKHYRDLGYTPEQAAKRWRGYCRFLQESKKTMTQRTCGNCRWWVRLKHAPDAGECRRHAPAASARHADARWTTTWETDFCGEWADGSITPEQEERRELVRRFAVAIAHGLARDVKMTVQEVVEHIWRVAEQLADAEPGQ